MKTTYKVYGKLLIFELKNEPNNFIIKVRDFPDEFMRTFEW